MKVKETFNQGCSHCGATGIVKNQLSAYGTTSFDVTMVCPVCLGTKVVIVTREYDLPESTTLTDVDLREIDNSIIK